MYENVIMKPLFCVLAFFKKKKERKERKKKRTMTARPRRFGFYLLNPRKSQWVSEQECNMTRGRLVSLVDWTEEDSSCLEWAP